MVQEAGSLYRVKNEEQRGKEKVNREEENKDSAQSWLGGWGSTDPFSIHCSALNKYHDNVSQCFVFPVPIKVMFILNCNLLSMQRHYLYKKTIYIQNLKIIYCWSSHRNSVETNLTSIYEDAGSTPGLAQWLKDPALL